jgi:hypothetical protein
LNEFVFSIFFPLSENVEESKKESQKMSGFNSYLGTGSKKKPDKHVMFLYSGK